MKPCIKKDNYIKPNQESEQILLKKVEFSDNVQFFDNVVIEPQSSNKLHKSHKINNNFNTQTFDSLKKDEKKYLTVNECSNVLIWSNILIKTMERECKELTADIKALKIRNKQTQQCITQKYTDIKKELQEGKLSMTKIYQIEECKQKLHKRRQVLQQLNKIQTSIYSLKEMFTKLVKNYKEQEKSIKENASEAIKKVINSQSTIKETRALKKFETFARKDTLPSTAEIEKEINKERFTDTQKSILLRIFKKEQQYIKEITTMHGITIDKTHNLFKQNHDEYKKMHKVNERTQKLHIY